MYETKHCPDCRQDQPLSNFTKNKRFRDGLAFYCTPCRRSREEVSRRKRLGPRKNRIAPPGVPAGMKWCPECEVIQPLDAFPRNRSQRSGMGTYCRPCHNKITQTDKERHGGARNYHLR